MTTDVQKLTKTKDVIAYLAQQFPLCFSTEGDAKPLKIGIFEDLATRLAEDDSVSKTRLRSALRHYTNSWRYLRAIKVGAERVDLDGVAVGVIEEEHQLHAEQTLAESKAAAAERAALKRKEEKQKVAKASPSQTTRKARASKPSAASKATKTQNQTKAAPALAAIKKSDLVVGQQVQVKAGQSPVAGLVTEIDRDDVHVQLQNGLTVKVHISAIFVTK